MNKAAHSVYNPTGIKLKLLVLFILFLNLAVAQPSHFIATPPKNLQDRLDSLYPKVKDMLWIQYDSGEAYSYEAIFLRDSDAVSLDITKNNKIDSSIEPNLKNIPLKIKLKFNSIFPNVKVKLWSKGDGGKLNKSNFSYFTAMFDDSPTIPNVGNVTLDSLSNIIRIEYTLSIDSLPKSSRKYIRNNYKGYGLLNNIEVLIDGQGAKTYLALVRKNSSDNGYNSDWLYFDSTGKFIKKLHSELVTNKI